MTGWSYLGQVLPWLRGQGVHLAGQSSWQLIGQQLITAGYTLAIDPSGPADAALTVSAGPGGARYRQISRALRLPASTEDNLDALADALRDLPERWPGTSRLALLVADGQRLIEDDLLSWTELALLLRQASDQLWADHQVLLGSVFFVPDGRYGADLPR